MARTFLHPSPLLLLLGALAGGPAASSVPLAAQETQGPLSPAGRLRVAVTPTFLSWDTRFGIRQEGGMTVETLEPLGFDMTRPDATELFADVSDLESEISSLLDQPFEGTLGRIDVRASADRARLPFRFDLGVFDWLTVGGTVPLVKNRTEVTLEFDGSDANLGVNPTAVSGSAIAGYIDALSVASEGASTRAQDLCSTDPGTDACSEAQALADDVAGFAQGITTAYASSYFFPAVGSEAGTGLRTMSATLEARLQAAGVGSLGELPLTDPLVDREALDAFFENQLESSPIANRTPNWLLGDVEVHAVVRLLEGERGDTAAPFRYQVGGGALVRLPTGSMDDPNSEFDLPSGDGQTDVEARVFADLGRGRLGVWADVTYGVQLARRLARRIGPPGLPLRSPETLANVDWSPGDYVQIELAPRFQLTEDLALSGGYRFRHEGDDTFELLPPEPERPEPPVPAGPFFTDVSLLELETGETRHEVGGGLTYSTLRAWRAGETSLPFETRFLVRSTVAGSGGRTAKTWSVEFGLRLYRRLWGS